MRGEEIRVERGDEREERQRGRDDSGRTKVAINVGSEG